MSAPYTTLSRIRAHNPCEGGYRKLAKYLGGVRAYGADTPITLRQIVESNGFGDALWCLRTMPEHDVLWRSLVVRYARRVQHLMTDPRSVAALDVAERYARGQATAEELIAAGNTAGAAAWGATGNTAGAAAGAAAWAAAGAAADADAAVANEREWQAQELIRISEDATP